MTIKNGVQKEDSYQINVRRVRAWMGVVATAITILVTVVGGVWAGVKFGVQSEVHGQIQIECSDDGMIHEEVERHAAEVMEILISGVRADIKTLEVEQTSQHDLGIRLETRQIAMEKKFDDNHREIMRWLRQAMEDSQ